MAERPLSKSVPESVLSDSLSFQVAIEDRLFRLQFEGGHFVLETPDKILTSEFRGDWDQYRIVLNDSDVKALFGNRVKALTGVGGRWEVNVPNNENLSLEIKDALNTMLENMKSFHQSVTGIMNFIILGYKVSEVWWEIRDGMWWIVDWVTIPNRLTKFDIHKRLLFRPSIRHNYIILNEPFKYLVTSYMDSDGMRYGNGLGQVLFHYVWGKLEGFKSWFIFNHKYAQPVPHAKYPASATEIQRKDLKNDLRAWQRGLVLLTRDDVTVGLLESQRKASSDAFKGFLGSVKTEIQKVIQGQALTAGEPGQGTGAYASYRVGDDIFGRIVRDDAMYLGDDVTKIGRWFTSVNFSPDFAPFVKYMFNTDEERLTRTDKADIIDKIGSKTRIPVKGSFIRKQFNLPAPEEDDEVIVIGTPAPTQTTEFAEEQKKKIRNPYLNT